MNANNSTTAGSSGANSTGNAKTRGQLRRHIVRRLLWVLIPVCLAALARGSVVFVDETEYVIIERLGVIAAVYDRPADRGPHLKAPWPIDTVRRFDRRMRLFDPPAREIFTRDKKNVTVDAYVCWKIAEPGDDNDTRLMNQPVFRFFRSLGTADSAEARLDNRLRSILATQLGQVELGELLNVSDSERGPAEDETGRLDQLSEALARLLQLQPGELESLEDRFGVQIVDARIQRINLPTGNQEAVFERMKSERRKIADRYRSAGMAENTVIKSQADLQYAEILAKAQRQAEEVRGQGEAEAIGILNRAHAQDPELHRVVQTLDTYRTILNEKTTLVLSASSNLLKLLTEGVAPKPADDAKPGDKKPEGKPTEASPSTTTPQVPTSRANPAGDDGRKNSKTARNDAPKPATPGDQP